MHVVQFMQHMRSALPKHVLKFTKVFVTEWRIQNSSNKWTYFFWKRRFKKSFTDFVKAEFYVSFLCTKMLPIAKKTVFWKKTLVHIYCCCKNNFLINLCSCAYALFHFSWIKTIILKHDGKKKRQYSGLGIPSLVFWAIRSKKRVISSFLVSDLSDLLTSLIKKEGMSESVFFKNVQKIWF